MIGPDKQLAAYQDYLHASVAKSATLYRIYRRDFWIPASEASFGERSQLRVTQ